MKKSSKLTAADSDRSWVHWSGEITLNAKPKAICKPCWELRYCPYGPLVERFPLVKIDDLDNPRRCRIFGHECPVFYVSEAICETKDLRRITRDIPNIIKMRILSRDGRICSNCGTAVKYEDIHFDHIIPWAKGGSSDEHNVRLLCETCNRKKGKKFEETFLIEDVKDHLVKRQGVEIVKFLLDVVGDAHAFRAETGHFPDAKEFAKINGIRYPGEFEVQIVRVFADLNEFFAGRPPKPLTRRRFQALKIRWGWDDGNRYKLADCANELDTDLHQLMLAEIGLVERLGWRVDSGDRTVKEKWLRT
jgi:hypothetical protein